MKTWVIGLGAIGNCIKDQLETQGHEVSCFSKHNHNTLVDISSETSIGNFVKQTKTLADNIIITCGLLYDDHHMPEKSLRSLDKTWLMESIEANVLPALYFLKAINAKLNQKQTIKCAIFSARVSSISDNRLGGWHSYRMSKCMLNMLIKNTAIEWQVKAPNATIFGYHPGTVDSHLSKPFQKSLKPEQLFTAPQAAQYFIHCLETRNPIHSGKLYDWQQLEIAP